MRRGLRFEKDGWKIQDVHRRSKPPQDIQTRTLEIAGLLGREFSLPLVQSAAGSDEGVLRLFEKGILTNADAPNQGKFLKSAEARKVAKQIPWSRRREYFFNLGEAARTLRFPPQEIASFFEEAQRVEIARDWWIKAAKKVCEAGDYPRALKWLDRALTLWPWNESPDERVRVLRETARCAINGGQPETARRVWDELADYAADAGQPRLQVEALRQLAGLATDAARTSEYLKRAAEVAERELSPAEAVRHILFYVEHLAERTLVSIADSALKRAVRIAEESDDPALLSETRGWQGLIDAMSGRHASAKEFVEESLRIALENDLKEQAALAYRRRANIRDYSGHYAEEKKAQVAAIEFCQKSKAGDQLVCMGCLSYACFRTGDWREAIRSARVVLRDAHESPVLKAIGSCVLGLIHAFRGERRSASNCLEMALDRFHAHGFIGMEFFALWGHAFLQYTDGELAKAREIFDRVRTLWRESDDAHDVVPALLFAGGVYADGGFAEQLVDCLDILGNVLRKNPLGEAKAGMIALKAEQARLDGHEAEFQASMKSAAQQYGTLGLPVERLWTECRCAKHGGQEATDASREEAAAIAKRLGMRPMLAALQCDASVSSPAGDLTPRQTEVLCFLAKGLTSKEIADRLGLSTRTVEMHVGRLLSRLNCRTRPEAVRAALERGWLRPDRN